MRVRAQFFRYAVVGLGSNLALYLGYLGLTYRGVGHKAAMSGLYPLGVLQTLAFNRRWSFGHSGKVPAALARYAIAYAVAYLWNLAALMLLVDRWGLPHRPTQAVLVLATAVLLFLLQKFWVFRPGDVEASDLGSPRGLRATPDQEPSTPHVTSPETAAPPLRVTSQAQGVRR